MTQNKLKSWQWILITIGVLLILFGFPCLLNTLILSEQKFEVVGEGKDWLIFWVTWLSAFASFAMVLITWRTLMQNKEQVDELKRQWEEQNRARLQFCLIPIRGTFFLKISNIGNESAYNINAKFNSEFLDMLYSKTHRKSFENMQNSTFTIEIKGVKYFMIGSIYLADNQTENDGEQTFDSQAIKQWVEKNKNVDISITGKYCNTYTINETFRLNDILLTGAVVMQSDIELSLANIQKGLTSPNLLTPIPTIQKSLKALNDNMNKIINKLDDNDTK